MIFQKSLNVLKLLLKPKNEEIYNSWEFARNLICMWQFN